MSKVIVYTSATCPKCTILKNFLKDRGIVYEERNVGEKVHLDELLALGSSTLPTLKKDEVVLEGLNMKALIEQFDKGDK